ncbi:MAG: hypothetical protein FWB88_04350 [Defluviitaleaceae bacterium]|nr:hypothetical protein [Defluviitaleaceae bacterium]MCL2238826.1 hypothetical protein [Defluviitaleaceae bacterium]
MKLYSEKTVVAHEVSDVRCNACGHDVGKDASGYLYDHISLSKLWGYHSPYDGEAHAIDLCVDCYQSWIGDFEIPPQRAEEELAYA